MSVLSLKKILQKYQSEALQTLFRTEKYVCWVAQKTTYHFSNGNRLIAMKDKRGNF